ncbi:GNAT family N-acetyltransferase [Mycetocola spongiae]|uniref:GNAT family N-acetyltransferase n=1 Tax=Mycetocola spongiae TaxID=2859226 RepID=UPI001CF255FE|nr:GNAT family protein [Mycetocola spongiae]
MSFTPYPDPRPLDSPWPAARDPREMAARDLIGAGLRLSPYDPRRDAAELFAALDHDACWAHVRRRPDTPEEHAATLLSAAAAGERVPWVVRLGRPLAGLAAGAVVGTTSFLDIVPADARLEIGSTAYTPAAWGGRVNPEAKLLLLTHAFEALGMGRVQIKTDVRNERSQRAIARLGARPEGVLRRHMRREDGSVRDTAMFSIIAEDWPRVRAGLEARLA